MRMRAIAVVIAIPILVSTSWAQNGPAKQERKSKTMQPSNVINVEGTNLVAPALDKYAHGPVAELQALYLTCLHREDFDVVIFVPNGIG
jgi:hypothetical protein